MSSASASSDDPHVREFGNFDALRLIAALSVIAAHAALIGLHGRAAWPPKGDGWDQLGQLGVQIFFVISGFLVSRSLLQTRSRLRFVWKRFLRIYPGLFVCLCATAALALFFSPHPGEALRSLQPARYVLKNLIWPNGNAEMAGAAFYFDGPPGLGALLNGSLWSIGVEVVCYLVLAIAVFRPTDRIWLAVLLFAGPSALLLTQYWPSPKGVSDIFYMAPTFGGGIAMSWLYDRAPLRGWAAGGCAVALAAALLAHVPMQVAFPIFGSYVVVWLGVTRAVRLAMPRWWGDPSYGLYLYGWPIEQLLHATLGSAANPPVLFVGGGLTALLVGQASWRLIERRALMLKSLSFTRARLAPED
jgi:peptidoglycan/LPS O-acetylase OafA/YrhL